MSRGRCGLVVVLMVSLAACAGDADEREDAAARDGAPRVDAAPADAGAPDAGFADAQADAGLDAGDPDSGEPLDAEPPEDAAAPDAELEDADVPDTAAAPDATAADATASDAGPADVGPYVVETGQLPFDPSRFGSGSHIFNPFTSGSITVTLPFAFTYFATLIPQNTMLTAITDGALFLGPGATGGANTPLPRTTPPHGMIAAFWDPFRVLDAQVSASADDFRLMWLSAELISNNATVTFEVRLIRRTGAIELRYYGRQPGGSATIGIESLTGTTAVQLPCSPGCTVADVPAGTVVRFVPAGPLPLGFDLVAQPIAGLPPFLYAGEELPPLDITARNAGTLTASPSYYRVLWSPIPFYPLFTGEIIDDGYDGTLPAVPPGAQVSSSEFFGTIAPQTPGMYRVALWLEDAAERGDLRPLDNFLESGMIEIRPLLGAISISTQGLPAGTANQPYSFQLNASGAPNPTWSASVSTPLPQGLTLSPSGLISGTPVMTQSVELFVTAQERGYGSASARFPLVIQ